VRCQFGRLDELLDYVSKMDTESAYISMDENLVVHTANIREGKCIPNQKVAAESSDGLLSFLKRIKAGTVKHAIMACDVAKLSAAITALEQGKHY
jgi:hypothetical protein